MCLLFSLGIPSAPKPLTSFLAENTGRIWPLQHVSLVELSSGQFGSPKILHPSGPPVSTHHEFLRLLLVLLAELLTHTLPPVGLTKPAGGSLSCWKSRTFREPSAEHPENKNFISLANPSTGKLISNHRCLTFTELLCLCEISSRLRLPRAGLSITSFQHHLICGW